MEVSGRLVTLVTTGVGTPVCEFVNITCTAGIAAVVESVS